MPRFNVQRPDGMWAVFSSNVDDYNTDCMTEEDLNAWRAKEYGAAMCDLKCANKNMITVYLCDQTKPCRHKKLGCSKYGGECRHTNDIRYAKYGGKPDLDRVWYEIHGDMRWEME